MFAPWRSQKSMRKHKDPITGNLFIKYLTERGGIVLAESRGHQLHGRSICLSCPCLSMKTKSEGCNHSIVQSVTFALFDSRVFSIRWQGLRIMKYKMDSRLKIAYLFERHTCKYVRKPWACSFNFSPFSHLPADLSYQFKKV